VNYVINQINFITGLNQKYILHGFFAAKNAGILFQIKVIINMVVLENQNYK